jgi:hypothetical protein
LKKFLLLMLLATLLGISTTINSQIVPEGVGGIILAELPPGWHYEFAEVIIKGEVQWVVVRDKLNWLERQWMELAGAGVLTLVGGLFMLVRFYVQAKELRKGQAEFQAVESVRGQSRKDERDEERKRHLESQIRITELATENKLLKAGSN